MGSNTSIVMAPFVWEELSKNVLFIEFEPLCQKLWAFMSNLASLSMITHQIWTSHTTDEHCKYWKFLTLTQFCIKFWEKSWSFWSKSLLIQKLSAKVFKEGGKHPSLVVLLEQTLYTLDLHVFLHVEVFFVKHWLNYVIKQVTMVDVKT